jgi:hypothetical protein
LLRVGLKPQSSYLLHSWNDRQVPLHPVYGLRWGLANFFALADLKYIKIYILFSLIERIRDKDKLNVLLTGVPWSLIRLMLKFT